MMSECVELAGMMLLRNKTDMPIHSLSVRGGHACLCRYRTVGGSLDAPLTKLGSPPPNYDGMLKKHH